MDAGGDCYLFQEHAAAPARIAHWRKWFADKGSELHASPLGTKSRGAGVG